MMNVEVRYSILLILIKKTERSDSIPRYSKFLVQYSIFLFLSSSTKVPIKNVKITFPDPACPGQALCSFNIDTTFSDIGKYLSYLLTQLFCIIFHAVLLSRRFALEISAKKDD